MPRQLFKPTPEALKFPGGKSYLAKSLWRLAPKHRTYMEVYAGGLAMLRYRDPDDKSLLMPDSPGNQGVSEIVGDSDMLLENFWYVLRADVLFDAFFRKAQATPFSEALFQSCLDEMDTIYDRDLFSTINKRVNAAWVFFVVVRQSMMGLGKSFAPISKIRCRRGMNEQVSAWLNAVDQLPIVHERLRRVLIMKSDGLELLRSFNPRNVETPRSVFAYLDPPYPHVTRTSTDMYAQEMTIEQHEQLLAWLTSAECRINWMLSTYPNELYTRKLDGYRVVAFDLPNNMSTSKSKERKQELVYMNYPEPT